MKRLIRPGRVVGLLPLAWLAACGSITPMETGDDGGVGGAGMLGSAGAGGGGSATGAGGGGGAGGALSNPDADIGKDGGAVDSARVDASGCMPGERRCNGPTPMTCDATGAWQAGAACTTMCSAGSCVGVCTPGAKMCVGNIPQYCDAQGLWQAAPACTFVCRQGDCTGVCLPGARQCSSSGAPQSCNADGTWDTGAACPFVCSQGLCSGVCKPGQTGCNGNIPQTCSSTGDWQSGASCPFVCTSGQCAGSCSPGARQCAGNVPQSCSTTGVWQDGAACPFVCASGACSGSCVPGATQCSNGQKQICDANGNWQATSSPPVQLLANPGFDAGHVTWSESTLSASTIITNYSVLTSIRSMTPPWLAWLGGYNSGQDDLSQVVTIPAGATSITLTFYYAIQTAETTPGPRDTMDVYTYDSATSTYTPLATFSDDNAISTWTRFSTSLPLSLAGRTIEVGFRAGTDAAKITNFFVDTVSLDVVACAP